MDAITELTTLINNNFAKLKEMHLKEKELLDETEKLIAERDYFTQLGLYYEYRNKVTACMTPQEAQKDMMMTMLETNDDKYIAKTVEFYKEIATKNNIAIVERPVKKSESKIVCNTCNDKINPKTEETYFIPCGTFCRICVEKHICDNCDE